MRATDSQTCGVAGITLNHCVQTTGCYLQSHWEITRASLLSFEDRTVSSPASTQTAHIVMFAPARLLSGALRTTEVVTGKLCQHRAGLLGVLRVQFRGKLSVLGR